MLCDLNVVWPTSGVNRQEALDKAAECVSDLINFGYHIVALNHTIVGKVPHSLQNPITPLEYSHIPQANPQGVDWKLDANLLLQARGKGKKSVRQVSRLTIVLEDTSQISSLASAAPAINAYDLVAIRPMTEKLFAAACLSMECDIISLDFAQRLPFVLRHSVVNAALARGIVFEVSYSAALRDHNARRNIIANAADLVRVTGGKQIIMTSAAYAALQVRNPFDVINLVVSSEAVAELAPGDTWKANTVGSEGFGGLDFVSFDQDDDDDNDDDDVEMVLS
ncbi:RNA-binding RNA processing protein rpp1 [Sorochytrium milnesiophthora]